MRLVPCFIGRRYKPDGCHPVCLNDTFKGGRYKISHKLGWGGHSTVWLAKDRKYASPKILLIIFLTYNRCKQWVSLKILTAASSRESKELQNLQVLQNCSQASPSSKHIVQLLDSFVHKGLMGYTNALYSSCLVQTLGRFFSGTLIMKISWSQKQFFECQNSF